MSHNSSITVTPGTERNFGIVFAVVFAIIGCWPLLGDGGVRWWSICVAGGFLGVAFLYPVLLKWPNYWWFRFGILLGNIIAPIVMGLVYVTTIVPMGLMVRLFRKDLLKLKLDENAQSYWVERDTPMQPMKNQF